MERQTDGTLTAQRWFHIVFLNAIWVFFPLWVLRRAYVDIVDASKAVQRVQGEPTISIGDATPQGEGGEKHKIV